MSRVDPDNAGSLARCDSKAAEATASRAPDLVAVPRGAGAKPTFRCVCPLQLGWQGTGALQSCHTRKADPCLPSRRGVWKERCGGFARRPGNI